MNMPRKTIRRALLWAVATLAVSLCCALGGLLVWLHTENGRLAVSESVTSALKPLGLRFSLGDLTLTPGQLRLHDIRLADTRGEWLTAQSLTLRPRLTALLRGRLVVESLHLATPVLFRLPLMPPRPVTAAPPGSPAGYAGFSGLPFGVAIESMTLTDGRVHTAILLPPQSAAADQNNPLLGTLAGNGSLRAKARAPLTAQLTLDAGLPDVAAIPATLAAPGSPLPFSSADLTTTLDVQAGKELAAGAAGTLSLIVNGERFALDYSFEAGLAGTSATLRTARIHGPGLRLDATATADTAALTAAGRARLSTTAGEAWAAHLARLTGTPLDGTLALTLEGEGGATLPLAASLTLTASDLTWPSAALHRLLGPTLSARGSLTGGNGLPYTATLAQLEAGLVTASATGTLRPAVTSDTGPGASAVPGITATADLLLRDLAPLVPELSGGIRAKASLAGTFQATTFSLEAGGESIRTPAGVFSSPRASLSGTASLEKEGTALPARAGTLAVTGLAGLHLGNSPAGPASLTASWSLDRKADTSLAARVHSLALDLAGTRCQADISLALPAGADPLLSGTATARVDNWRSLAALTGLPLKGEKASLDLVFRHSTAGQAATLALRAASLDLPGTLTLRDLALDASATGLRTPDITLTGRMGSGRAGLLDWRSGAATVTASQGAGSLALALRANTTAGAALKTLVSAPAEKPGPPARTDRLTLVGTFAIPETRLTLTRLAARLPGSPLGVYLTGPATFRAGEGLAVSSLSLAITPGSGSLVLDAAITPAKTGLNATLARLPFRLARDLTGLPFPDGTLDATASLNRQGRVVSGSFETTARVTPLPGSPGQGGPPLAVTLRGTVDALPDPHFPALGPGTKGPRLKAALFLDPAGKTVPAEGDAALYAAIPLRFTPAGLPSPDPAAPLAAKLAWQGQVGPLWNLLPLPDRRLTGLARINGEMAGTLAAPRHSLEAYLAEGRYEDAILGLLLTNIAVQAKNAATGVTLLARAEDGRGGSVALEGDLLPAPAGSRVPRLVARAHVDHLAPLHRDDIFLRLSGRLEASGPLTAPAVQATLAIERGELSLVSALGGGVRTLPITGAGGQDTPPAAGPTLDVRIAVPNRFFIRGPGLESEWAGELAVTGPVASPSLTGSLRPVRGAFDLLTKPFAFTGGEIRFFGGDRIDPGLDLTLTYTSPAITALVRAEGSARKPSIRMESIPFLPQDQIIAAVLFGKDITDLSRFEALQVASAVRDLAAIGSGGGGMNPLTSIRAKLGVDMLRIGSTGDDDSGRKSVSGAPGMAAMSGSPAQGDTAKDDAVPTLEAGKYINDAIYVGVEQGPTTDSTGVRVEVELAPNLSLQGKTTSRSSEVGIGWKKDY